MRTWVKHKVYTLPKFFKVSSQLMITKRTG